ncbi:hypothetical protein IAT38_002158 [Cryptococcus sp. DSM 104549]
MDSTTGGLPTVNPNVDTHQAEQGAEDDQPRNYGDSTWVTWGKEKLDKVGEWYANKGGGYHDFAALTGPSLFASVGGFIYSLAYK